MYIYGCVYKYIYIVFHVIVIDTDNNNINNCNYIYFLSFYHDVFVPVLLIYIYIYYMLYRVICSLKLFYCYCTASTQHWIPNVLNLDKMCQFGPCNLDQSQLIKFKFNGNNFSRHTRLQNLRFSASS